VKTCIDCIPCIVGQGVHYAKKSAKSPAQAEAMVKRILESLLVFGPELPPPVMARKIHEIARGFCGPQDLYLEEKDSSTRIAHEVLASLKGELDAQPDRFEALVRLAIAGNIIDFGAYRDFDLNSVKSHISAAFQAPIDKAAIRSLESAISEAESILYIADNCGEAVFDRLFMEPFRSRTTLAVRGGAILNDITRRELAASGLAEGFSARVIDTGDFTPGISFAHSSKEFLEAFESADLIISKGQGNYETLSETARPVFFLLRAKCKVIAEFLGGVEQGSLQVIGANIGHGGCDY
jgi:damage-control phosphatase, subfamily I